MTSLCCAGGDFGCPGTCKVARLDGSEGMKCTWPSLYFFYFLTFLSHLVFCFHFWLSYHFHFSLFLKPQPTRAIAIKCDGSVYHIDVDVDVISLPGATLCDNKTVNYHGSNVHIEWQIIHIHNENLKNSICSCFF